VPASTARSHAKALSVGTKIKPVGSPTLLTTAEEIYLARFITQMELANMAMTRQAIRAKAGKMAKLIPGRAFAKDIAGNKWLNGFIERSEAATSKFRSSSQNSKPEMLSNNCLGQC
jgi:hypothetical protein